MKKYITIAALLAAGSAFANADALTLISFDTQAAETAGTIVSDYDFSVETHLTVGTTAATGSGSKTYTDGDSAIHTEDLRPNTNVGLGGSWSLAFTITNEGKLEATIESLSFEAFTFNSSGATQENVRTIDFAIGTDTTAVTFDANKSDYTTGTIKFNTPITIAAGGEETFTLNVSRPTTGANQGTFVGLGNISVKGSLAVPEPSAFGLLAGIGALALVASRRRRK